MNRARIKNDLITFAFVALFMIFGEYLGSFVLIALIFLCVLAAVYAALWAGVQIVKQRLESGRRRS